MYQQIFAAGEYNSAAEYDTLLALARDEYESEQAREEYETEATQENTPHLVQETNTPTNSKNSDRRPIKSNTS